MNEFENRRYTLTGILECNTKAIFKGLVAKFEVRAPLVIQAKLEKQVQCIQHHDSRRIKLCDSGLSNVTHYYLVPLSNIIIIITIFIIINIIISFNDYNYHSYCYVTPNLIKI